MHKIKVSNYIKFTAFTRITSISGMDVKNHGIFRPDIIIILIPSRKIWYLLRINHVNNGWIPVFAPEEMWYTVSMEKLKPYLSFSAPGASRASVLFKAASVKNAQVMREKTVEEHREANLALADVRIIPPGMQFEQVKASGVPCEWAFRADSAADKVILYIHGGSWSYGSLKTAKAVAVLLCEATGCRVLTAEYRLSPEWPYPAAIEDCSVVYRWLCDNGYRGENIAVFGDSAGGNLTLALMHRLKAQGRPMPCALGLASPAPDLRESSAICRGQIDQMYSVYQGREQNLLDIYIGDNNRENPMISPMCGDLAGFPPTLIHVGQDEALYLDCDLFAQKAYEAGVEVSLEIWREMFHDFSIVGNTLKESRLSIKEFGEFFQRHLRVE